MPVRVASDHDLENAGAPGSESRTAEEPCGCVLVTVRELMGSELAACSGEIGKEGGGERITMFCPTSHAAALVAVSSLTTRQNIRVGSLVGWRNLSKRRMGYFVRGEREGVRVGGGWASSGPWWPHVWPA